MTNIKLSAAGSAGRSDPHRTLRARFPGDLVLPRENYQLDGPDIAMSREAAQAFAMAIHELATNAVKHGPWSSPEGRVNVTWTAHRAKGNSTRISFCWRENGCEIDTASARKGYGSRVLEGVFRHSLDGTAELTLHPDGAEFVAEFTLQD